MIELNRIRKLEKLDEMQKDLTFFINESIIVECYKDHGLDEEDYEADREQAISLLAKVHLRRKSLAKHLANTQVEK